MDIKKEDLVKFRDIDGRPYYAIRADIFDEKSKMEVVIEKDDKVPVPLTQEEAMKAAQKIIKEKPKPPKVPETDPREAEIIKLKEQLAALQAVVELAKGDQAKVIVNGESDTSLQEG